MGNSCCACSRSSSSSSTPVKIDYKQLFGHITHPAQLTPLIDYIEELFKTEQPQESRKTESQVNDVVKNSIEGASKLMEAISANGDKLNKDNFASKLPRLPGDMTNVITGALREIGNLHWVAVGFSLIAFVLNRIEQVSSVSKKCVHLLEIMFHLSRRLQTLHERMPHEEEHLSKATCVIVEGIIFCLCCRKQGTFFKYLFASIDDANLQHIEKAIDEIYREILVMLGVDIQAQIPRRYRPSKYVAPADAVETDRKVEEVIEHLDMEGKGPARGRAVVLYGFGGIGKTTLAKCVLSKLDLTGFKHCKVELDEKRSDLEWYQGQLYEGLTEEKLSFDNCPDGQQKLKEVLEKESTRYFIFIDNVLRMEQINNLLPTKLSIPSSSMLRLLVTSRQLETVIPPLQFGGRDIDCKEYPVQELSEDAAKKYFRGIVERGPKIASALDRRLISLDQIDAVAKECHGVPLVLTVYAQYLAYNGDDPVIYDEIIAAFKQGDFKEEADLTETLLYVYRKLSQKAQDAFVDICTYFHGWERDEISFIIGTVELKALEHGSLINIGESEKVVVHDILRALGIREGKKTRIQNLHDFETALGQTKKLDGVKGMWLLDSETSNMDTNKDSFNLEDHHLTAMNDSLRVLAVGRQTWLISACDLSFPQLIFLQVQDLDELPILRGMHALKYMKITMRDDIEPASSLKMLQNMKNLGNLQKIAFKYSKLQNFPPDFRPAASLRELDLSGCISVQELPHELGRLCQLKKMILDNCKSLEFLSEEFCELRSMMCLSMISCSTLARLPSGFGNLCSLQSLEMWNCVSLEALPNDFGNLSGLHSLDLDDCEKLKSLPSGFGNLCSLQSLKMRNCVSLEALPNDFGNLSALQSLDLSGCKSLEALPNDFGNLSALYLLDLHKCEKLKSLPSGFGNLCSLQSLKMWNCVSLEALPNAFGNLSALESLNLGSCEELKSLPSGFGNLCSLQSLKMWNCVSLEALPNDFRNLSALYSLDLHKCEKLKSLPSEFGNLCSLQSLEMRNCVSLEALPNDFGNLSALKSLDLSRCKSLEALPNDLGKLSALYSLHLQDCEKLKSLPSGFGNLCSLKSLKMWNCVSLEALPNDFGNLSALYSLDLHKCEKLKSLPSGFGNLCSLQSLKMWNCVSLEALPNDFGKLSALESLDLDECEKLKSLPSGFGNLCSLQSLEMRKCVSLEALPNDFGNLGALQSLKLGRCEKLKSLPDGFHNLLNSLQNLYLEWEIVANIPHEFNKFRS